MKYVLVIMLVLFLSGCASTVNNFDLTLVKTILVGKTTKAEIMQMFGKPYKIKQNSSDGTEKYSYSHIERIVVGLDLSHIQRELYITFANDVVIHCLMTSWSPSREYHEDCCKNAL